MVLACVLLGLVVEFQTNAGATNSTLLCLVGKGNSIESEKEDDNLDSNACTNADLEA